MTDSLTDRLPPLQCSQGGIPYNKEHLDALQAKSDANAEHARLANANQKRMREALEAKDAEIERLQAKIHRKDERIKAWQQSSDEHEAEIERLKELTENDAKEIGSYRELTGLRGYWKLTQPIIDAASQWFNLGDPEKQTDDHWNLRRICGDRIAEYEEQNDG